MTDKEIIMDGVDVSECENLMQGIVPFGCMEDRKTCSCMNNPNCLYKQLKRKEQDCNQLRIEKEELRKCYKNNSTLLDFEEINPTKLANKVMKLKQTLAEIKFLVRELLKRTGQVVPYEIKQILQKINECEAKYEN